MVFFLFLVNLITHPVHAQQLDIVTGEKTKSYSLAELKKKLPTRTLTNNDPVYKRRMTFKGFRIKSLIELAGPIPTELNEISFTAKDGYSPSIPLKELLTQNGIVAFNLSPATQNGKKLDLNPFYVVWENDESVPEYFPRPYQLTKIEFQKFSDKFKAIYAESEKEGFQLFRTHCFKCHAINGTGGTMGPELNSPNNVLEYWDKSKLKNFIKDPNQFRANSKMPRVPDITDKDIDLILAYFDEMKSHKK
jgi:cytochrome c2